MDNIYSDFAEVYDRLQEIDYASFVKYYIKLFNKYNCSPKLMLDLGCGTGNITIPLSKCGYDMIGVDISEEMLFIASEKARKANINDILFLNQDMTMFELYGTVDAAICALDGVNYLTEDDDLSKLFSLINNYLNPGGLFIFDINTPYKLKNILGGNTYIYDKEDTFCVWNSEFDEEYGLCDFYLDFFVKDSSTNKTDTINTDLYRRKSEVQTERAWTDCEIKDAAMSSGMEFISCFEDRTENPPTDLSERVFYIFKKLSDTPHEHPIV